MEYPISSLGAPWGQRAPWGDSLHVAWAHPEAAGGTRGELGPPAPPPRAFPCTSSCHPRASLWFPKEGESFKNGVPASAAPWKGAGAAQPPREMQEQLRGWGISCRGGAAVGGVGDVGCCWRGGHQRAGGTAAGRAAWGTSQVTKPSHPARISLWFCSASGEMQLSCSRGENLYQDGSTRSAPGCSAPPARSGSREGFWRCIFGPTRAALDGCGVAGLPAKKSQLCSTGRRPAPPRSLATASCPTQERVPSPQIIPKQGPGWLTRRPGGRRMGWGCHVSPQP